MTIAQIKTSCQVPPANNFPATNNVGHTLSEEEWTLRFHANMALGMERILCSCPPIKHSHEDWFTPLTDHNYAVLDVAKRSITWKAILRLSNCPGDDRGTCNCPELRDHSLSAHHYAVILHLLFFTGPGSILCHNQDEEDIILETSRLVVHLFQYCHPKFYREDYLPNSIRKSLREKADTDYDQETSTGGYYQGYWPNKEARKLKILPQLLANNRNTIVDRTKILEPGIAAGFSTRELDLLIEVLERLPDKGKAAHIAEEDIRGLMQLGRTQAWKLRNRWVKAGFLEQGIAKIPGGGTYLWLKIPEEYKIISNATPPLVSIEVHSNPEPLTTWHIFFDTVVFLDPDASVPVVPLPELPEEVPLNVNQTELEDFQAWCQNPTVDKDRIIAGKKLYSGLIKKYPKRVDKDVFRPQGFGF